MVLTMVEFMLEKCEKLEEFDGGLSKKCFFFEFDFDLLNEDRSRPVNCIIFVAFQEPDVVIFKNYEVTLVDFR